MSLLHPVSPNASGPDTGPDWIFFCPGCQSHHGVWTKLGRSGPVWHFDGNMEKPTVTPSLRMDTGHTDDAGVHHPKICHLEISAGQLRFVPDCYHELSGKTVPMEQF